MPDSFQEYIARNYPDSLGGRNYKEALRASEELGIPALSAFQGMEMSDVETEMGIAQRMGYTGDIDMERVVQAGGTGQYNLQGMYFPQKVGDYAFSRLNTGARGFIPTEYRAFDDLKEMRAIERASGLPAPTPDDLPDLFTRGDYVLSVGKSGADAQTLAHEFYHRSGVLEELPVYSMTVINAPNEREYKSAVTHWAWNYAPKNLKPSRSQVLSALSNKDVDLDPEIESYVLGRITEKTSRNRQTPSQMVIGEYNQGKRGPRTEAKEGTFDGIASMLGFDTSETPEEKKERELQSLYKMRVSDSIFGKRRRELGVESNPLEKFGMFSDSYRADPEKINYFRKIFQGEPRTLIPDYYRDRYPGEVEELEARPTPTMEELIEGMKEVSGKSSIDVLKKYIDERSDRIKNEKNVLRGTSEEGIGELMNKPRPRSAEIDSRNNAATAKTMRKAGLPVASERDAADLEPEILDQLNAIMGRSTEE